MYYELEDFVLVLDEFSWLNYFGKVDRINRTNLHLLCSQSMALKPTLGNDSKFLHKVL
jgi:hypothetical protein